MEQFQHISPENAFSMLSEGNAAIVDIRDEQSFQQGRIKDAFHLTNGSLQQFTDANEFDTPVIVCCYHGISSQQAAQFLIHQGFEAVYSLDGGFEQWRKLYPFISGEDNT
ncbi:thiosulfate sulfurtransferase GlpE [Aestuariibacter sp. AA17]|uniref:Thiosulfate sulfurtransferase GlpE n=1 Tax=Fluctibacter corallii TaxID=2984329 RepID=A0ABT3AD28_9ALTE|nr:thiosulfate sulfurtransferase GlpE [Aestuariibacter sp. AA17]MCV2886171.1 thiosulfate sulfurtransferase GlpE [Aestuariibacter sp. AA17]